MRHIFFWSLQARALNLPMDQWSQLVASHFDEVKQAINSLVTEKTPTGADFVHMDLLNELDWANTRKCFDYLKGEAGCRRVRTRSVEF